MLQGCGNASMNSSRSAVMDRDLTPEQQAEAQRLTEILHGLVAQEVHNITQLLASKDDRHLLGKTEFELRDIAHRLASRVLQTALAERKKGATKAPA
jgi:hypothetical protein